MSNPDYEKLVNAALHFVSFRPRSEKELRDFLYKKHTSDDIEKVIERMRELGYVDDKKFAAWWAQQRSTFRPRGKRVILLELKSKGVTEDIEVDEIAMAKKALRKKQRLDDKNEIYKFLMQRGFSSNTIRRVIDDLVQKD